MIETGTYVDWRQARAGCITASQFKRVMDAKTPRAWRTLLADIRSEAAALEQGIVTESNAAALQWGKDLEPRALANYSLETGNDVEAAPFVRMDGWPIGASPDGYVGDDGLVEVKCPFSLDGFGRYLADGYESARAQVQGQLWVTGRAWCDFVAFDPRRADEDQLFVQRVERDEEYIEFLALKVQAFARYLIDGTEPEGAKFEAAA